MGARISTHALTWSATRYSVSDYMGGNDFNSRAHVERDEVKHGEWMEHNISTHALTWSATKAMGMCVDCGKISTHALTWSATRMYYN